MSKNEQLRDCKKHGNVPHRLEKDGHKRCKMCVQERITEHRRKTKRKLVDHFGGKCTICEYDKCVQALQFHHIDPSKKEFGISNSGITRSWDKLLVEANKCILVCGNCHVEIEQGITQIP